MLTGGAPPGSFAGGTRVGRGAGWRRGLAGGQGVAAAGNVGAPGRINRARMRAVMFRARFQAHTHTLLQNTRSDRTGCNHGKHTRKQHAKQKIAFWVSSSRVGSGKQKTSKQPPNLPKKDSRRRFNLSQLVFNLFSLLKRPALTPDAPPPPYPLQSQRWARGLAAAAARLLVQLRQ